MIVDDLHIFDTCSRPVETDAKLVVHADTVLPSSFALEGLELVAGWNPEIFEPSRDLQLAQLAPCYSLDLLEPPNPASRRKRLRRSIFERQDHPRILTRGVINVKRYDYQTASGPGLYQNP